MPYLRTTIAIHVGVPGRLRQAAEELNYLQSQIGTIVAEVQSLGDNRLRDGCRQRLAQLFIMDKIGKDCLCLPGYRTYVNLLRSDRGEFTGFYPDAGHLLLGFLPNAVPVGRPGVNTIRQLFPDTIRSGEEIPAAARCYLLIELPRGKRSGWQVTSVIMPLGDDAWHDPSYGMPAEQRDRVLEQLLALS